MNLTERAETTALMRDYQRVLELLEQQRNALNELAAKLDRAKRALQSLGFAENENGQWINKTL